MSIVLMESVYSEDDWLVGIGEVQFVSVCIGDTAIMIVLAPGGFDNVFVLTSGKPICVQIQQGGNIHAPQRKFYILIFFSFCALLSSPSRAELFLGEE